MTNKSKITPATFCNHPIPDPDWQTL